MSGNNQYGSTWQMYSIPSLSGGLNVDTADLAANEMLVAQNIDLDSVGNISKRSGTIDLLDENNFPYMNIPITGSGMNAIMEFHDSLTGAEKLVVCHDGVIKIASHDAGLYPRIASLTAMTGGSLTNAADRPTFAHLANKVIVSTEHDTHWFNEVAMYSNGITVATLSASSLAQGSSGIGASQENVECQIIGTQADGFSCVGKLVSGSSPEVFELYTNTKDNVLVDPSTIGDVSQISYAILSSSGRMVSKIFAPPNFTVTIGATKVTVTMLAAFDDAPGWITNVAVTPPQMAEFKYQIGTDILAVEIASISDVKDASGKALTVTTDYTVTTEGDRQYILLNSKPSSYGAITCTVVGAPDKSTFTFSATYLRSGDYEIETNGFLTTDSEYPEKELDVGTGYTAVMTVPRSSDPQVDKIRVYISTAGGAIPYFVKEVSNPGSGSASITLTQAEIEAVTGTEVPSDNFPPPFAKYVLTAGSRVFYANTNDTKIGASVVKWSNINDPNSIGSSSFQTFDPGSEEITAIGSVGSYVVVFSRNKTWLLDAYDFGKNNLDDSGCLSHWSIQSILDGSAIAYLSPGGVCVCDGQSVKSISLGKVDSIISKYVDAEKVEKETVSFYNSLQKKYTLCMPAIGGGQVVLNCFFNISGVGAAWTEYILPDTVSSACQVFKDDGSEANVICAKDGTNGYIMEMEYKPTMGVSSRYSIDHANNSAKDTPVTMDLMTVPLDLGLPGVVKQVRRMYLNWRVSANKEARKWVSGDVDNYAQPDPGHSDIKVFSSMGCILECSNTINYGEHEILTSAKYRSSAEQLLGRRNDRVNLRGKDERLLFSIKDSSPNNVTIFRIDLMFYPVANQGVVAAASTITPTPTW